MKKSAIISAVLGLTLAFSGAAYALWNQDMNINGTVNTASFDVHYNSASTSDTGADIPDGLDIASTTATVGADNVSGNVTVTNAYPGYTSTNTFIIHNNSSIPVKIKTLNIVKTVSAAPIDVVFDGGVAQNDVIAAGGTANVIVKNTVPAAADLTAANGSFGYTVNVNAEQAQ